MNGLRTMGTLLLAGLITPAGLLFSQPSANAVVTNANSTTANLAMARRVNSASPAMRVRKQFSTIQNLAQNVRKQVGTLKFGTNGTNVTWKFHAIRLQRVKHAVNKMETNVNRLEARKANLAPWQQQLLANVKENTHELAYQTSAAIKTLNAHHNTVALGTAPYQKNIHKISQNAKDAATTIGNVFQYHGYILG